MFPQTVGYFAQTPTLDAMQERYGATFGSMSLTDKTALLMALAEQAYMLSYNHSGKSEALHIILENWGHEYDDPALADLLAALDQEIEDNVDLVLNIISGITEQLRGRHYAEPLLKTFDFDFDFEDLTDPIDTE